VRVIPDTHVVLWYLTDSSRLASAATSLLEAPTTDVLLSSVVVWEIAIKRALGRLDAPERYRQAFLGAGAQPLAIEHDHAEIAGDLPPHHRDPFDRMLVAQAKFEDAVIVTADAAFAAYDVRTVW
jgi:PIN domain nuclease of toxin-antitoxin system